MSAMLESGSCTAASRWKSYARLQSHAKPCIDTTEEPVVSRALDALDALEGKGISPNGNGHLLAAKGKALRLSPDSHKLAHTRLITATVDGKELHRPKWNSLMNDMHVLGRTRLGSFDALRKASGANLRQGRYEDSGYKYLPEAELSIQGVDANLACEHSFRLAKAMNMSIRVTFEWRDKDDAAHPGESGVIGWNPNEP